MCFFVVNLSIITVNVDNSIIFAFIYFIDLFIFPPATRLRVPALLSMSPGDTGMARGVKRAYSSLDTLGIRVGVFLRRYPLARILVILYMVRLKKLS